MKRDFLKALKGAINKAHELDNEKVEIVQQASKERPSLPRVNLFNIYKRSLPVGLDQIVVIGVTKEEAEEWVEHRLKPKAYQDDTDNSKTVIYYDILPQDATPKERSIFFNNRPVTK